MDEDLKTATNLKTYTFVFIGLAVITILEIILSRPGIRTSSTLLTPTFLLFSLAKAGMVAAFFMHLRSDSKLYTAFFLFPAALLLVFALLASVR